MGNELRKSGAKGQGRLGRETRGGGGGGGRANRLAPLALFEPVACPLSINN